MQAEDASTLVPVALFSSTIADCSATFVGGAINVQAGTVHADAGSSILRCGAMVGGGIFTPHAAWLSGGSSVRACAAVRDGGGVHGSLVVDGASEVADCGAGDRGGGVFLAAGDVLVVDDGAVRNCDALDGGGVAGERDAWVVLAAGGAIEDNVASRSGGGVHVAETSTVDLRGRVAGNAARDGGGLFLGRGSRAFLRSGASLEANAAADAGGGLAAEDAALSVHGGVVFKSNAAGDGGAASLARSTLHASASRCRFVRAVLAVSTAAVGCGLADSTLCDAVDLVESDRWALLGDADDVDGGGVLRGDAVHAFVAEGRPATVCAPTAAPQTASAFDATSEGWRGARLRLAFPMDDADDLVLDVPSGSHANGRTFRLREDGAPGLPLFEANAAVDGGALHLADASSAFLDGVKFADNRAGGAGGAVHAGRLAAFVANNSLLQGNAAAEGGALYGGAMSSLSLTTSLASGNAAAVAGGAVAARGGDRVAVADAILKSNTVDGDVATPLAAGGGAVALFDVADATLDGATLRGNAATRPGALGGAVLLWRSTLGVGRATTFEANVAHGGGGALAALGGSAPAAVSGDCRDVAVFVDWRRTTETCLPTAFLGLTGVTCDAWAVEGTKACEGGDKVFDCAGCACSFGLDDEESKARYFTITRDGEELGRGGPAAAALRRFDFCLPPGKVQVRAFDDFGQSWFGGSFSVRVKGGEMVAGPPVAEFASAPLTIAVGLDRATQFVANEATAGGGGALFADAASTVGGVAGDFRDNAAPFGPTEATSAAALVADRRTLRVRSGVAAPPVSVTLLDALGQVVATDGSTVVVAGGANLTGFSGGKATCRHGVATFADLVVVGRPGAAFELDFAAAGVGAGAVVLVEVDACGVGDQLVGDRCEPCAASDEFNVYDFGARVQENGNAGPACARCPRDADCAFDGGGNGTAPPGADLRPRRGYWRSTPFSSNVAKCKFEFHCKGGVDLWAKDADACGDRREGALCAFCEAGFVHDRFDGSCVDCRGAKKRSLRVAMVVVGLGLLFVAGAVAVVERARVRSLVRSFGRSSRAFYRDLWPQAKQLIAFWQICGSLQRTFDVLRFPRLFRRFALATSAVSLNFYAALPGLCREADHVDELVGTTLWPLASGAILVAHAVKTRRAAADARGAAARLSMGLFLLLAYVVVASCAAVAFATFDCDDHFSRSDGEPRSSPYLDASFLRIDYRVDCASKRYARARVYAVLMVVVYPVGVPLLCFVLLWRKRDDVDPPGGAAALARRALAADGGDDDDDRRTAREYLELRRYAEASSRGAARRGVGVAVEILGTDYVCRRRARNDGCNHLAFLFAEYEPARWWFEPVDMLRRIVMTCLLPAIGDGDTVRRAYVALALARAGKESEIPSFKGSYLGRFPLVSADFWTSDHLSERTRRTDAFSERARAEHSC